MTGHIASTVRKERDYSALLQSKKPEPEMFSLGKSPEAGAGVCLTMTMGSS